jgi:metallophosphoesterase (TIGR03767 family)
MRFSRRDLLRASAAVAAVAVADGGSGRLLGQPHAAAASATPPTTRQQTLLRGSPVNAGGYRRIICGPGEPHTLRTDLGGAPSVGRTGTRRPLLTFGHLTDLHVIDAQSPARVEFLDRYNDTAPSGPFAAAYRPQEMLSTQVANAMIATVRSFRTGPVLGAPVAFSISTGDAVDNCQYNELRWMIDLLDGGSRLRPDSGDPTRWEGVADRDPTYYDTRYWHPDGPPRGQGDDVAHATYGFPRARGLLAAARRPYSTTGLATPWFAAYGNHDGLVQGNAPVNSALAAIATGSLKVVGLQPNTDPNAVAAAFLTGQPLPAGLIIRPVTADPNRRLLSRRQTIDEHFHTTGTPSGHGFTTANQDSNTAYYCFDPAEPIQAIVLDTVNPGGLSDGSLDRQQFDWLSGKLAAAGNRLVVLFSHHTIGTMTNPSLAPGETAPRVLGDEVRALLLAHPQVVLWVNGHTHVNQVTAHARPPGQPPGGFWELNTASHIDWPQQSRLVEMADNRDGTLSIFGTILDFCAPPADPRELGTPLHLAALSRELSANDWQERTGHSATVDGRRGEVQDRNVELIVPDPRPTG